MNWIHTRHYRPHTMLAQSIRLSKMNYIQEIRWKRNEMKWKKDEGKKINRGSILEVEGDLTSYMDTVPAMVDAKNIFSPPDHLFNVCGTDYIRKLIPAFFVYIYFLFMFVCFVLSYVNVPSMYRIVEVVIGTIVLADDPQVTLALHFPSDEVVIVKDLLVFVQSLHIIIREGGRRGRGERSGREGRLTAIPFTRLHFFFSVVPSFFHFPSSTLHRV